MKILCLLLVDSLHRFDAWAKTWSRSQLLFIYAVAAFFIAALAYQQHVIHRLQTALGVLVP